MYIEENKSSISHFVDSWRIYKLILAHFFRYTVSSLICAVADTGAFALLGVLLGKLLQGFALTAAAGVGARVLSSLLNFFLNKKLVFRTNVNTGEAMLRYYCLAIPQMVVQVLLTQGVYALFAVRDSSAGLRTLIYAIVMAVLYVISYMIQQRWVCPRNIIESRGENMKQKNTCRYALPARSGACGCQAAQKEKEGQGPVWTDHRGFSCCCLPSCS